MPPDFILERTLIGSVCGIDEAGRGPLAGPVVAAAVLLPQPLPASLLGIDDSKRLSKAHRTRLCAALEQHARLGIGHADVAEIDQMNILQATLLAMRRAYDGLAIGGAIDYALVDGNQPPRLATRVHCVVGGDRRSLSIAAASIVAKVTRDRIMENLAISHPDFGWSRNAGYGTPDHLAALARLGPTRHHRRSFAPVARILARSGSEPRGPTSSPDTGAPHRAGRKPRPAP